MSEMYRPALPPAAPDHDRHDPLLVAQLAAGDRLDPTRAQEAQGWLATCAACDRLAADLRAVSAAVASEPAPARRRDFRLDPVTAEQLRGNALTRFLRGLSLPRARAFAPAAAGILAVGLVFVAAGYAWPDDAGVPLGVSAEPNAPTAAMAEAPTVHDVAGADGLAMASPPALEMASKAALPDETLEERNPAEAPEGLAQHQAGSSAQSASMEQAVEAELDTSAGDVADTVGTTDTAGEERVASAAAAPSSEPETALFAVEQDTAASSATALDTAAIDDDAAAADAAATTPSGAAEPEGWLLTVGVVLSLGGAMLLLLAWLARRSADPLLR